MSIRYKPGDVMENGWIVLEVKPALKMLQTGQALIPASRLRRAVKKGWKLVPGNGGFGKHSKMVVVERR